MRAMLYLCGRVGIGALLAAVGSLTLHYAGPVDARWQNRAAREWVPARSNNIPVRSNKTPGGVRRLAPSTLVDESELQGGGWVEVVGSRTRRAAPRMREVSPSGIEQLRAEVPPSGIEKLQADAPPSGIDELQQEVPPSGIEKLRVGAPPGGAARKPAARERVTRRAASRPTTSS